MCSWGRFFLVHFCAIGDTSYHILPNKNYEGEKLSEQEKVVIINKVKDFNTNQIVE